MSVSPKIQARVDLLNVTLAELQTQLAEATAKEVLVVGNQYSIHVGKGDTARVIEATLIGQRTKENGAAEFRFSHGEGFDARFYDVSFTKVVTDAEGLSSAKVAANISRVETKINDLLTGKVKIKGLIEIENGSTYNIKVGKGETAGVVPAVLMEQRTDENGNQEFAFFTGAGFDAQVIICKSSRVVLEEVEETDAEETDVDGTEESTEE